MPNCEKFSHRDLEQACDDFAMLAYWPAEARASVMRLLAQMCPHREALRWLVAEVVNHVGKWPGSAELRGILCSRYEPADGIDQWSELAGYRAEDGEARYLAAHEAQKAIERSGALADESRAMIRQLAAAKKMPGAQQEAAKCGNRTG